MNLFEKIYSYHLHTEILRRHGTALALISHQEKSWLKAMLSSKSSHDFLSQQTWTLLSDMLRDVEEYPLFEAVLEKGKPAEVPKLPRWWKELRHMILKEQSISLDFCTRRGEFFQQQVGVPYRLEYVMPSGEWYLLWWPDGDAKDLRLMRTPLQLLERVEVVEGIDYQQKITQLEDYLANNVKSALIELNPDHNIDRDRVFYALSCFNRQCNYDEENDIYRIWVYYEADEEAYFLNRLRFLGSWVILLEPPQLRETMLESIKKARSRYE